ncbi:hypothetical protein F383_31492 [Gossypium arboreum]|uniref:Uncharacterized protein n=1 Tax=Gossypium arboreum TaxID=29729 RepID=A0A0B0PEF4_GOSAR|nr:hypothetical protein F383_31492 [Gossypium arboreum]
MRLGLIIPP